MNDIIEDAKLLPCPMCGSDKGYSLSEGSTYRWWNVICNGCGRTIDECASDRRMTANTELPKHWEDADETWNDAAEYAHKLTLARKGEAVKPYGYIRAENYDLGEVIKGQWLNRDKVEDDDIAVYTAPPDLQARLDELQKIIDCMTETAKEASNRAIDEHNLITKYHDALHEINNKCRGRTTNYGVARAIACNALGIKHTDSKQPPSSEVYTDNSVVIANLQAKLEESDNRALGLASKLDMQAMRLGEAEAKLTKAIEALNQAHSDWTEQIEATGEQKSWHEKQSLDKIEQALKEI
jgi:hypothetical protein